MILEQEFACYLPTGIPLGSANSRSYYSRTSRQSKGEWIHSSPASTLFLIVMPYQDIAPQQRTLLLASHCTTPLSQAAHHFPWCWAGLRQEILHTAMWCFHVSFSVLIAHTPSLCITRSKCGSFSAQSLPCDSSAPCLLIQIFSTCEINSYIQFPLLKYIVWLFYCCIDPNWENSLVGWQCFWGLARFHANVK